MSDIERLAEIEARHNSVTSEDRIGPKRHAQYVLLHEDMPWLLARIRELEDEKNAVYDKWDADCQKQDARIRELEAQAEVVAAEKRHRRAASQIGIFETTDGGQTWRHVGDREEYDASYKALVIARAAAEKGE